MEQQLIIPGCEGIIQDADAQKYQQFVDKFKPKKTTDDCYTPPEIYDALAQWVSNEYGIDRARFMRAPSIRAATIKRRNTRTDAQ